jgi:uncharacterized membrane protein
MSCFTLVKQADRNEPLLDELVAMMRQQSRHFFAIIFATRHDLLSQNWQRGQFSLVGELREPSAYGGVHPYVLLLGRGFAYLYPSLAGDASFRSDV